MNFSPILNPPSPIDIVQETSTRSVVGCGVGSGGIDESDIMSELLAYLNEDASPDVGANHELTAVVVPPPFLPQTRPTVDELQVPKTINLKARDHDPNDATIRNGSMKHLLTAYATDPAYGVAFIQQRGGSHGERRTDDPPPFVQTLVFGSQVIAYRLKQNGDLMTRMDNCTVAENNVPKSGVVLVKFENGDCTFRPLSELRPRGSKTAMTWRNVYICNHHSSTFSRRPRKCASDADGANTNVTVTAEAAEEAPSACFQSPSPPAKGSRVKTAKSPKHLDDCKATIIEYQTHFAETVYISYKNAQSHTHPIGQANFKHIQNDKGTIEEWRTQAENGMRASDIHRATVGNIDTNNYLHFEKRTDDANVSRQALTDAKDVHNAMRNIKSAYQLATDDHASVCKRAEQLSRRRMPSSFSRHKATMISR